MFYLSTNLIYLKCENVNVFLFTHEYIHFEFIYQNEYYFETLACILLKIYFCNQFQLITTK